MIFRQLTLKNFRVFNGEHTIELAPRKDGVVTKPIVLFGGLNGAGKTSILTAIRLLLMGKRAVGNITSTKDYSEYLARQINNKAKADCDAPLASIGLEFTHTHKGIHNTFIINRLWDSSGKETLTLKLNDEELDVLSGEQVQAILSEMIPPGIGDLFFFDGEKIAELAEDDTGVYLKEAVQKLLGIDVVNRLNDDLDIYLKQVTKDTVDKKSLDQIKALEKEQANFYKEAQQAQEKAEQLRPHLIELRKSVQTIEANLQARGGAWAKTKKQEKARADQLVKDEHQLNGAILQELDGAFPISLAPTAIANLIGQLEKEQQVKQQQAFSQQFESMSSELAKTLADKFDTNTDDISALLGEFIKAKQPDDADNEVLLDISDSDFYRLKATVESASDAKKNVSKLLGSLNQVQTELASLSINIERAPDEEELAKMYEKLRELDKQITSAKENYKAHLFQAKDKMTKALEIAKRLEKLFNQQKNEATVLKAVTRVNAAQSALGDFSARLTHLRVTQLEELFATSYRRLARKGDLKLGARIDAKTFDVSLVNPEGIEINRKSLSAGEKQIFAFAILEALGKLSGKVLPVVVDTPLGRLDSKHRDKLITHYFPEAGEQVILLSTDTEVDEDFYALLSDKVSHTYEIDFDEKARCSSVKNGYFWENKKYMEAV
ncbi:DNA sulfur modification protein DndD [Alteromonas aestuariivivens]|uniref:DNA sulfur modification protein DndD n=1 Tax=Alteromonas aestuariivivens TaxID=1938339 RepID=A0A3D8M2H3_9ALTE|nr:DNA sulfur modification protein DndD [Alteromonas aestuariivivens]RDV23907.1 DNA sulfur modification protein DndD [Alteromonas aestuariivivens]